MGDFTESQPAATRAPRARASANRYATRYTDHADDPAWLLRMRFTATPTYRGYANALAEVRRATTMDAGEIMDGLLRARIMYALPGGYLDHLMTERPAPPKRQSRPWNLYGGRTAHAFPGDTVLITRNVGPDDTFTPRADIIRSW